MDLATNMDNKWRTYIKYRIKIQYFYFLFVPLLILIVTATSLWRNLFFFCIGAISLISIILAIFERIKVKCPYCGDKPSKPFFLFPRKCPHCGNDFLGTEGDVHK